MSSKNAAVFGVYSTHAALEAAVDALRAKGFRNTDISVLATQKPEFQAKQYESRVLSGGMLLSVHTDDEEWFSQGKHILEETGAEGITSTRPSRANPSVTIDHPPTARVVS